MDNHQKEFVITFLTIDLINFQTNESKKTY